MVFIRKKVCLIGSDGSGKTSIILRYTKNTFSNSYLATLGCDFYEINFDKNDDQLQIFAWDVASQKNFEKMRSYYLTYSHLNVIVVDIHRTEPEYIVPWIDDVKSYTQPNSPYIIALNKIDLAEDDKSLNDLVLYLESEYNVKVFQTSAKTGENVKKMFDFIGESLWSS